MIVFNYILLFFFFLSISFVHAQGDESRDSILGRKYYEKITYSNPDTTFFYAQKAAFHLEDTQDWEKIINAYYFMAAAKRWQSDFLESMNYIDIQLKLSKEHFGEKSTIYTNGLIILGSNYSILGSYEKAMKSMKKAIKLHKEGDVNKVILSSYYENLGILHRKYGEYESSISCLKNALRIGPSDINSTYRNLGDTYLRKNDLSNAKKYLFKSLALLKNATKKYDAQKQLDCYQGLGKIYLIEEKNDSVRYCIRQLNKIRNRFEGDFIADYHRFEILGEFYANLEEIEEAEKMYNAAILAAQEEFKDFERHHEIASMMQKKANFAYHHRTPQKALDLYQEALIQNTKKFQETDWKRNPDIEQFQHDTYALNTLIGKTTVLFDTFKTSTTDLNFLKKAFETTELASDLIFKIRQNYTAEESRLFLSDKVVPFYEMSIEIALKLHESTQDPLYLSKAFQFSEANKALLLLESIQQNEATRNSYMPDDLVEKEKELKLKIAFYEKIIAEDQQKLSSKTSSERSEWKTNLFNLKERHQSFIDTLKQTFPDFQLQSEQLNMATLESIQKELPNAQNSILEIFVGKNSIFLFLIYQDGMEYVHLSNIDDIRISVENLLKIVHTVPKSDSFEHDFHVFCKEAQQLYNTLLRPIFSKRPTNSKVLTIIPDGFLSFLPFEILLSESPTSNRVDYSHSNLDYVFETFLIHYNYSASLVAKQQTQREEGTTLKFLGFAPSFGDEHTDEHRSCVEDKLYGLRCNQNEIRNIQSLLSGGSFLSSKATKTAFLETANDAEILHLATHACMDAEQPKNSKIFFSDGYLTTYDLVNLDLNNKLTVLSACNTGTGKLLNGEGVLSLAREFTLAGSPSTLTSLWAIDDCSTSEIMNYYYEHLMDNMSKDKALQLAKLRFLDHADRESAHPFYWAAFLQFGSTEPLFKRQVSYYLPFILGGIILFFFIKKGKAIITSLSN